MGKILGRWRSPDVAKIHEEARHDDEWRTTGLSVFKDELKTEYTHKLTTGEMYETPA